MYYRIALIIFNFIERIMAEKTIIGIDPGKNGAIVILGPERPGKYWTTIQPFKIGKTDTQQSIIEFLEQHIVKNGKRHSSICYLEEPPAFIPSAIPSSSIAKLMINFGEISGVLGALRIPNLFVRPPKWQKAIIGMCKLKGMDRKKRLQEEAFRLYPSLKPTRRTCDAILIAEYGRRLENKS